MGSGYGQRHPKDHWKFLRDMIHGADAIVEVLDARDVAGTRLGIAERWAGAKRLLVVANKADLLPKGARKPKLQNRGIFMSAKEGGEEGRWTLLRSIMQRTDKRPMKAIFIGYPNVGKSSLINLLVRRQAAKVSPVAGTTKDIQWVKVSDELMVSDYRGMFPKSETKKDLVRKGAVKMGSAEEGHAYDFAKRALGSPVLKAWLEKRYGVDLSGAKESEDVLRLIAVRRGWMLKGGEPNVGEAARHLLRAMAEAPEI
jgi:ribosome biogenesis GTPase A